MNWLTRVVLGGITGYQWLISPLVGSACRFAPTCSEYARLAVIDHGRVIAEGTSRELKASVGSNALHLRLVVSALSPRRL